MLDKEMIEIGGKSISYGMVIVPIAILMITYVVSGVLAAVFNQLRKRADPTRATFLYVTGKLLNYLVIFLGLFFAISVTGVDMSSLSIFAGALGVGVGLGLQDIVKNFTYGLLMMFENSVEVGDFVELHDGTRGKVVSIGARATTITTNDNVDVLVPNSTMMAGSLTNWTHNQATRRIHVKFRVANGSDKEIVKKAALEAAAAVPFTQDDGARKRSQVWLTKFGDYGMEFELLVWPSLDAVKRPGSMEAAYLWALDDALAKYGLEVPLPQMELRVRSLFGLEGDEALGALSPASAGKAAEARAANRPAKPTARAANDAAQEIAQARDEG